MVPVKETMNYFVASNFFKLFTFTLVLLLPSSSSLTTDGILLLSFKYSILNDPLSVLDTWNYDDPTPCSWTGVTCTQIGGVLRVTSLIVPNSQLLGSISDEIGAVEHLRHLDLSNNYFNGSIPVSILNSTMLQVLSVSSNSISGEIPEIIGQMRSLQYLNLSDNALSGQIPGNLTRLESLTVVSLRSNYFSGDLPRGFTSVEFLDLSSNLLNGSLPLDFNGGNLGYLNLSYNKITGSISPEFVEKIPGNATIDFSFNNLTGAIPETPSLINQKAASFSGNVELCGKPLNKLCSVPSTLSKPPPNTTTISPAIAVMPKSIDSVPVNSDNSPTTANPAQLQSGLKPGTIAAIAVADLAGVSILALIIFYVYQVKKRKRLDDSVNSVANLEKKTTAPATVIKTDIPQNSSKQGKCSCLPIKGEETASDEATTSSDSENNSNKVDYEDQNDRKGLGKLVTVDDRETEIEVERLFKAAAYILGTSSGSIVYKAVLEDGTAFAVRRIGDSCNIGRMKEFENRVRAIAKMKHPNLVRVRGFYWGDHEKLVIYDYVSNGSLASFCNKKPGSSPYHLPFEVRLKIVRGAARGLAYIHDKKHVHGSIKPSNILLTPDMEPILSDFGLNRLVPTNPTCPATAQGGLPDQPTTNALTTLLYQAPESLKNPKPNPKWDVYSFGIILLELLSGRGLSDQELSQMTSQVNVSNSVFTIEEKYRVLRMADVAIRADMDNKEDAVLACFKLGFSCVSLVAQKRPSMKEVLQMLEKVLC